MLRIKYFPFAQIMHLNSADRVKKIIDALKEGCVIIIDCKIGSKDEALLIRETMEIVDEEFKGMEIGVMSEYAQRGFLSKIRHRVAKWLVGDRTGITIIGPANIISELHNHPENLDIHFSMDYLKKHSLNAKTSSRNDGPDFQ